MELGSCSSSGFGGPNSDTRTSPSLALKARLKVSTMAILHLAHFSGLESATKSRHVGGTAIGTHVGTAQRPVNASKLTIQLGIIGRSLSPRSIFLPDCLERGGVCIREVRERISKLGRKTSDVANGRSHRHRPFPIVPRPKIVDESNSARVLVDYKHTRNLLLIARID